MKKLYIALKDFVMKTFFAKGRAMPIMKGPLRGYKYVINPNVGFASMLGGWEKKSQEVYQRSIFKDFVVFDIGANYGIHSMLYSKLVGKNGKVYAFEPLPENVGDIKRNLAINKINNITIVEEAISDSRGTAEFVVAAHHAEGSLISTGRISGQSIKVATNSLDNFCATENVFPDFVKIDIEGAETYALKGFDSSISKTFPFFSVELHSPECDKAAGQFFSKHGYEVYRINDDNALSMRAWDKLLERIEVLDASWPNPKGVWGVIWCVHPSRKHLVQDFINHNS